MEELSDKVRELVYKDNAAELDKILEKHSYFAFRDFLSKGLLQFAALQEAVSYNHPAVYQWLLSIRAKQTSTPQYSPQPPSPAPPSNPTAGRYILRQGAIAAASGWRHHSSIDTWQTIVGCEKAAL